MADRRLRKGKTISSDKITEMTGLTTPKVRLAAQRIIFCAKRLPESCGQAASEITEDAYQIISMNNSFKEYFDIISGEYRLENQLLELSGFSKDLCAKLLPYVAGKGIALSTNIPDEKLVVLVDRERFQSALLNIVKNSVKYTKQGNRIIFKVSATKKHVKITIRDRGAGMYEEVLEHCCEPFFTRDGGEAMGFGLTLAKYFTNESGGKLRIKSEQDEGTTVELQLPLYQGDAENSSVSSYFESKQEADPELIKIIFAGI